MEEISKEEFKEYKKNVDGQQKAINLGYDRIKAKGVEIELFLGYYK